MLIICIHIFTYCKYKPPEQGVCLSSVLYTIYRVNLLTLHASLTSKSTGKAFAIVTGIKAYFISITLLMLLADSHNQCHCYRQQTLDW